MLGLVQGWLDAGRPDAGKRLGSFEAWARVVGGVLGHAGFVGFLDAGAVDEGGVDPEEAEWQALIAAWGEAHGTVRVRASELLRLARSLDLGIAAPDRTEHATRARFGRGLGARRQRVYGAWRVCDAGRKQRVYWLGEVAARAG